MSVTLIISAVKDLVILIAISVGIYLLISYGKDIVKVSDMATVQKQIAANAKTVAAWHQEQVDADTQRSVDLAKVNTTIDAQHAPVFLQSAPSCRPVSGHPATAQSQPASSGTTDSGRGTDLRPAINAFERKYETALSDCRDALAQWPTLKEIP